MWCAFWYMALTYACQWKETPFFLCVVKECRWKEGWELSGGCCCNGSIGHQFVLLACLLPSFLIEMGPTIKLQHIIHNSQCEIGPTIKLQHIIHNSQCEIGPTIKLQHIIHNSQCPQWFIIIVLIIYLRQLTMVTINHGSGGRGFLGHQHKAYCKLITIP